MSTEAEPLNVPGINWVCRKCGFHLLNPVEALPPSCVSCGAAESPWFRPGHGGVQEGAKFSHGKPRWSLLPLDALGWIVQVLTKGALKYAEDNWRIVPNAKEEYYNAFMRHLEAYQKGELLDDGPKGTGLPHLACMGCNLLFLISLEHCEPREKTFMRSGT
jgi:hypothetical protein